MIFWRWLATGLTALLVVTTVTCSARRVVAQSASRDGDRLFFGGDLGGALAAYRQAAAWDPSGPTVWTDIGDTAAWAASKGSVDTDADRVPRLAVAGLEAFARASRQAVPGSWAWSGIAQVYDRVRAHRLRHQELALDRLSTDPVANLLPEDRLTEAALLQALQYDPRNYFHLDALAELYWSRGVRGASIDAFRDAVTVHPMLEGHYHLLDRLVGASDLSGAVAERLEAVLARSLPADRWVINRELGRLAVLTGTQEDAARYYESAVELAGDATLRHRAALRFSLAQVYQRAERDADAVPHLEAATELQPERALYHATLGGLLGRLGHHTEAGRSLATAHALEPGNASIVRAMALAARRAGDLDRAERAYQNLMRLDPDLLEPYLLLIEMFRAADQPGRAIPYARELARREPREPLYRRQLQQLYAQESGR